MKNPSAGGFTLVEILITLLLTGILMSAVYRLYLNTQRTVLAQEDVVDLQQNLRFAMDHLTRDLRMAGFLVSTTYPPLKTAPHTPLADNPLILHTASPKGVSARLSAPICVEDSQATFPLTDSEMVDLFEVDDQVRLLRPSNQSQPLDKCFRVTSRRPAESLITLDGFDPSAKVNYQVGDVLVPSASYPGTVSYYLKDAELFVRYGDGDAQRLSAKKEVGGKLVNGLTGFALAYVTDDGVAHDTVPSAELQGICAVRVILSGRAQSAQGAKLRSLQKVIALRNRYRRG